VSTAVLDPCARPALPPEHSWGPGVRDTADGLGGGIAAAPSLDEVLTALWSELERGQTVTCVACGGTVGGAPDAERDVAESCCESCGSTLS
jgi:hypothetical protein